MFHPFFGIFSSLFIFVYLAFIVIAIVFVYRWMTQIISLKKEQNEILKEIASKLKEKE